MIKPFSQASANNRDAILKAITPYLLSRNTVLEIGSGTGQHAVYFGEKLNHLIWQTSDLTENHEGIQLWLDALLLDNVLSPINLDVNQAPKDHKKYDALYTANTFHFISWQSVKNCIAQASARLDQKGLFIVYGPFNYNGVFTSESNERFEQWLKATDEERGIRDFEKVNTLFEAENFLLLEDHLMPANNRLIIWEKKHKNN